ncbi:MAG: hypothetical protein EA377_12205 [Phycisphaerales bacterium]|nr:MAG: hypothetical protein EA377_12205 [Phycisphaerales bacterium]
MSSIPSNLARVPNTLASSIMLNSLNRTNQSLLNLQVQLASGQKINRPSDSAAEAGTISVLDDQIERRTQRIRNIGHGESVLNTIDSALGDATNMLLEAKEIGLSQVGATSDKATRKSMAVVIESMVNEMVSIANRKYQGIHLFGGSASGKQPMVELLGGWKYQGEGNGLFTDMGLPRPFPITVGADQAFGVKSTRVEGSRDLDPQMVGSTRLQDLNGARGLGVSKGTITVDVDGVTSAVDLSSAHDVQDVIDALEAAIQQTDPGAVVQIDPVTGNRLEIIPSGGSVVTITDLTADTIAADLGIAGAFDAGTTTGQDLDPKLTEMTPVTSLSGVTVPLGTIRLENAGQVRDLDLSGAETVRDIMNAVDSLNIGIRVEINEAGDRLNFVNELSGGAMSISEVAGGTTATELGVRSLSASTLLSDFNNGRGVSIESGNSDPVTGLPDPDRDVDFMITLKDGTEIEVDLAGAITVQDVLDMINDAAIAEGVAVPADFEAGLAADGNGITLTDNTPGTTTSVTKMNNSGAAADLGLLGSTDGAILTGEDRATVAVDSVITNLMALAKALKSDDSTGIEFATAKLEDDLDRFAQVRGEVGARSRRLSDAKIREEDMQIQDMSLKSQVQDLDFTEAAMRFATLEQQLLAGLQTTSRVNSLSLLDFLR